MKHLKSILKVKSTLLGGVALVLSSTAFANEAGEGKSTTIIHAGQVLAVPGQRPLSEQSIYISDNKIVKIVSGYQLEKGASVIDLSDSFVLPGFIDSHVHLA